MTDSNQQTHLEVMLQYDPLGAHDCSIESMRERCGILLDWARQTLEQSTDADAIRLAIFDAYGFPCPEPDESTLSKSGMLSYPGDPDIAPLAITKNYRVEILIYNHELIAFRDSKTGSTYTTRMD